MRISIVSEGDAEYYSLAALFGRVAPRDTILQATKVNVHPTAPFECLIPRLAETVSMVIESQSPDIVYVLLDLETLDECPGERASSIEAALTAALAPVATPIHVVIKNRKYENWLVSDIEAVKAFRGRFEVSQNTENAVSNNNADHADAEALLRRSIRNGQPGYAKISDAQRIVSRANPCRMAKHSRSFRRLMRLLRHPCYSGNASRAANHRCDH